MIQEVEQHGAIFRVQQFPSSNTVDIELSLYLVMSPLLTFRTILGASQQQRNGGMKSSVVRSTGRGIRQGWFATQKRFRRSQIFASALPVWSPHLFRHKLLVTILLEFHQQRLGLLQVFCLKPLSEPAVDVGQHLSG